MQTTSFELSKELDKKISIASDFKKSYFFWVISPEFDGEAKLLPKTNIKSLMELGCKLTLYPAYTLDEILEMLPDELEDDHVACSGNLKKFRRSFLFRKEIFRGEKGFFKIEYIPYQFDVERPLPITFINKNPAEAAGQLLAWCIENGHIKL